MIDVEITFTCDRRGCDTIAIVPAAEHSTFCWRTKMLYEDDSYRVARFPDALGWVYDEGVGLFCCERHYLWTRAEQLADMAGAAQDKAMQHGPRNG